MSAGNGTNDVDLTVEGAQAARDELEAQRVAISDELTELAAQAVAVKERAAELAPQVVAAEQALGDALALEEARNRGGAAGAVLARSIAATMPDPVRAARFAALADELAPPTE